MRTLIIATALLTAFAAQAEPKHVSNGPLKPISLEKKAKQEAAVDPQAYQPKVIEAKPIELVAPELEIKTKDVSDAAVEKKLASRKTKSNDTNALRDPPQLKPLDDASAPASSAPTAAQPANKP